MVKFQKSVIVNVVNWKKAFSTNVTHIWGIQFFHCWFMIFFINTSNAHLLIEMQNQYNNQPLTTDITCITFRFTFIDFYFKWSDMLSYHVHVSKGWIRILTFLFSEVDLKCSLKVNCFFNCQAQWWSDKLTISFYSV